jgi:hypothetical protein
MLSSVRTTSSGVLFGGAAVPELGGVEHRSEHRRRVARAALPAMADRGRHVVGAAGADAVAGIAGDQLAARQARIEEQHVAQFDLFGRQRFAAQFLHALGNGAEQCGGVSLSPAAAAAGSGAAAVAAVPATPSAVTAAGVAGVAVAAVVAVSARPPADAA